MLPAACSKVVTVSLREAEMWVGELAAIDGWVQTTFRIAQTAPKKQDAKSGLREWGGETERWPPRLQQEWSGEKQ